MRATIIKKIKIGLNSLQLVQASGNKPPTAWNINRFKHECLSMKFLTCFLLSEENSISRHPCFKPVDLPVIYLFNHWIFAADSMFNQWAKCNFNNKISFDVWKMAWLATWIVIQLPASGLLGWVLVDNISSIFLISSQELIEK